MFAEDLQQQRVRAAAVTEREPRVRGGVRADEDVHDPHVVREGLGRGVPPPGRDVHAVLDRDPPARAAAVARQGAHADGLAAQRHLVRVLADAATAHRPHPTLVSGFKIL